MQTDDLLLNYAPQTVSTGNAFCIVALRSVEALSRLAIPQREATAWLRSHGTRWFYCIAPVGDGSWRARMQWYSGEDPATGSAAGPCIAWLVKKGLAVSQQPVVLEQGVEMLRPSRITAQAELSDSEVRSILVSGRTIPVAEGRFFLP
jgi:trans-2,3-dihydro-3-hydroxyanthranilate isomerase